MKLITLMRHSEKYRTINKFLEMSKHPNILIANKCALRSLWGDVWHKVGIEWPKNHLPDKKFKNNIYNADPSSLETICKVAEDCGIKLIKRLDENEIELVAPGADDLSIIMFQDNYDDSLNYEYSDLKGLTVPEAIKVLKASQRKEKVAFDYICLRFKISSEFTGLRCKILEYPPQSEEFREFLKAAKSKLEVTVEILQNAVDMSEEPVKTNAQAEREAITLNIKKRCAMMKKRYAFLSAMVSPFNSFDEIMIDKSEWCAIIGINLTKCVKYLEITINLVDGDYETYFAVPSKDGHLTISEIIRWQDNYCANSFLNIFTQKMAVEDEILAYKN